MKVAAKLMLGFLVVPILFGFSLYVSLLQIQEAHELLNNLKSAIDDVSDASRLDTLAQFIRYYDEVLTQSARNYAFTGDRKWEQRYRSVEPELDKIIKESIENGDDIDKDFFSSVDEANKALVELEYRAIDSVNTGNREEAIKILESDEYWGFKQVYERGLKDYVARRGAKYNEDVSLSTQILSSSAKNAEGAIDRALQIILPSVIVILILSIALGVFLSNSIVKPMEKLRQSANKISRGQLSERIEIKSKDEIGELAEAFDNMRYGLGLVIEEYEKKKGQEELLRKLKAAVGEKEKAEKVLEDREKRFRTLIENSSDVIVLSDRNAKITYITPSIRRVLGYLPEDMIGKVGFSFVHPDDLERSKKEFENVIGKPGSSATLEVRTKHKNGNWIWVESVMTNSLDNQDLKAVVSNFRDITDRKEMEARLGNSRKNPDS